jgi:hypothetical protein
MSSVCLELARLILSSFGCFIFLSFYLIIARQKITNPTRGKELSSPHQSSFLHFCKIPARLSTIIPNDALNQTSMVVAGHIFSCSAFGRRQILHQLERHQSAVGD